jgi:Putative phage tail protein
MHIFILGFILLFSGLATRAISQYLASLQRPQPPAPFVPPNVPTGLVIPVLYGTQRLPGITTWFGQSKLNEVDDVQTFLGFTIGKKFIDYEWTVTCQQLYCWGPVTVSNMVFAGAIPFSDLPLTQQLADPVAGSVVSLPAYSGDGSGGIPFGGMISGLDVGIMLPSIYGGIGRGGGFMAAGVPGSRLRFYNGALNTVADSVIEGFLGAGNVPAYGDFATMVFDNVNVGESSFPPQVDLILYGAPKAENLPDGFGSVEVNSRTIAGASFNWVASDLSAAAIIYDLLVDQRYGKGEARAGIRGSGIGVSDGTSGSFEDANRALGNEGLGISLVFTGDNSTTDVQSTIDTILAHIDGVLRRNPVTQQRELKLIRDEASTDLALAAVRGFDEKSIQSIDQWGRPDWEDTINAVTVTFSNAEKLYQQDTVTLRNPANYAMTGSWRTTQTQYLGFTDKAVALRAAARDLKKLSMRLWRGTVKLDRSAWDVREGDVITLTYAPRKLNRFLVRVLTVDLGEETNGVITLGVMQDAFSLDDVAFTREPGVVPLGFPTITPPRVVSVAQTIVTVSGQPTGQATIVLFDPENRTYEIAYRVSVGGATPSSWTVAATATPNTSDPLFPYHAPVCTPDLSGTQVFQVPLTYKGQSSIEYRITAIGYGTIASPDDANIVIDASVTFAALTTPSALKPLWFYTLQSDGTISVTVNGIEQLTFGDTSLRVRSFDVSLHSDFSVFYNFDVTAGFILPADWLTPPWTTPNLGSVIGGPLFPGDSKVLYLRVNAEEFDPATSLYDPVTITDQVTVDFGLTNIGQIGDVSGGAPINGDTLVFDSGTGLWTPSSIAGGGGGGGAAPFVVIHDGVGADFVYTQSGDQIVTH